MQLAYVCLLSLSVAEVEVASDYGGDACCAHAKDPERMTAPYNLIINLGSFT